MKFQINLSERDTKLLLLLFFLLMIAASYFFVYQPTTKKVNTINSNNVKLRNQLEDLTRMEEQSSANKEKIKSFQDKTKKIKAKFPAGLNIEDTIIIVDQLEKASGITISSLAFNMNEAFYPAAANSSNNGQVSGNTESSQAESTTSNSSSDTSATTGSTDNAPTAASNNGAAGEATATTNSNRLTGYKSVITITYKSTYAGLKKAINYINQNPSRMTLDNMTAIYDNSTGNLAGNIAINMYSLVDNNSAYVEPFIDYIRTGRSNIFGTVEKRK